jgi:hypothetical protein
MIKATTYNTLYFEGTGFRPLDNLCLFSIYTNTGSDDIQYFFVAEPVLARARTTFKNLVALHYGIRTATVCLHKPKKFL